jgi:hypothetical protein
MEEPKKTRVTSTALLAVATVVLLAVFVTSGLAGSPNARKYGFKNSTANVSDLFYTEVCTCSDIGCIL